MSEELKIECKWLGREVGSEVDRRFYADIGLAVGEDWMTLLEDLEASTVRSHVRGCGYHLAQWFAANWWRLRWEPEARSWWKDADWRVAHSIAAAGGGDVWPNVLFVSDGDSLGVASVPRPKGADFEPVRYLNRVLARITAAEFEQKVDSFMEGLLSRMHTFAIAGDNLPNLWAEVLSERQNPEAAQWRKLEALCGYDPEEAPVATIEMLLEDKAHLGGKALEEMAAQGRHSIAAVLNPILELASPKAKPTVGGFRGKMPNLPVGKKHDTKARPWEQAASLAQLARKEWGLGNQPVSNKQLADLLGTKPSVFSDRTKASTPIPIALRTGTNGRFDLYFDSAWANSRRFASTRLLGDHLYQPDTERLIPATHAKTSRQQFQRAFAQEFLCPFDALLDKLQTDQPNEEDIAEAAAHFDVSPLMVRTTLVNKGELDRETLNWAA